MAQVSFGVFSKRRNSTKQPLSLSDVRDVKLKEPTSIDHPSFIITGDPFTYNYCIWDGRYYFIDNITSLHNGYTQVDCVIDVLATYKADILASTQFVSYSSVSGSVWLPDTRIPITKQTLVDSRSSLTGILSTIGCYVLTVVGKSACTSYVIQSQFTLAAILDEIQNWRDDGINNAFSKLQNPSSTYTPTAAQSVSPGATQADCFNALFEQLKDVFDNIGNAFTDIQDKIGTTLASVGDAAIDTGFIGNAYQNAPQCIRSCIWVPFDYALAPVASGVSNSIYLGVYDTQQLGIPITSDAVTGQNTVDIPWHYSDWRRSLCEDVYLFLPLVGLVPISGDSVTHANQITIHWSVTFTDGVITYKLECGGEIIGTYAGQCSANYPMGLAQQASAGEIFQSLIGGVEKMASTAINAGSSLNPAAWAVGGVSLGMEAFDTSYDVANAMNTTHVSCVGGVGGGAGIGQGRDCVCYTVAHPTVIPPANMQATMGLPTMQPLQLSQCSGYCQCANAHVDAPAMAGELNAIDAMLNSGFFIE